MKLRTKTLLILILLIGLALLMFMPHENRSRRALEEYKQQLRAKGEKLTIAENIPPYSTKTPNGASNFLSATNLEFSFPDIPSAMRIISPGVAMIAYTGSSSNLSFNYAENAQRMANLRKILDVAVLDFRRDYTQGASLPMQQLARLKEAQQLASGTAMQALHANDFAEARLDLHATVDLLRLDENEVTLISGLVRIAMAHIAVAVNWEGLQNGEWTEAQLLALQKKWQDLDLFVFSEPMLKMERAESVDAMSQIRTNYQVFSGWLSMASLTNIFPSSGADDSLSVRLKAKGEELYEQYVRYPVWKSRWSFEEERCCLQILEAAITACRDARTTGAFLPAFREFNQSATNINRLFEISREHFSAVLETDELLRRFFVKFADTEVERRLLVTAIALKRYQLQHGGFPETLQDLMPKYLAAVPMDFMDGKPLRYRVRAEGGFLLYSVGEDGEDNGGDATMVGRGWLNGRDIVWPRAATTAEAADYLKRTPAAPQR